MVKILELLQLNFLIKIVTKLNIKWSFTKMDKKQINKLILIKK